jgi:hypothetical protein
VVKRKAIHDLYARIPEELWQQLKALAVHHKRSVTAETAWALQQYVDAHWDELPDIQAKPARPAKRQQTRGPRKRQ